MRALTGTSSVSSHARNGHLPSLVTYSRTVSIRSVHPNISYMIIKFASRAKLHCPPQAPLRRRSTTICAAPQYWRAMEAAGQTPWTGGGNGRTPLSPPKRAAAGRVSRRLRYFSKNQVENRGLVRTSVEAATASKCRSVNEFAPEVVRHQEFTDLANFRFDSRRLHHLSPSTRETSRSRVRPSPECLHDH